MLNNKEKEILHTICINTFAKTTPNGLRIDARTKIGRKLFNIYNNFFDRRILDILDHKQDKEYIYNEIIKEAI